MENKNWIIVVLIILVALVAYNFSGMTGAISKEQMTTITVSPTSVTFEKYATMSLVNIKVNIGSIGVDKSLQLYQETESGSVRVGAGETSICNRDICNGNVELTYKVPSSLEKGTYFFRAERDNYDGKGHDIKFDSNLFVVE